MTELKPCPFCGGEAEIVSNRFVKCKDCRSRTWTLFPTLDESIEAWNARAERTCRYLPDVVQVAFNENDEEIETGEAHADGCDYSCTSCGFTMVGGEIGWFEEIEGDYGGWTFKPRFNYCPNCGAKVVNEE